jgi:hypothetical protein
VEDQLKQATVGLVTYEDFKRKRENLEQAAAALLEERKDKGLVPPPIYFNIYSKYFSLFLWLFY